MSPTRVGIDLAGSPVRLGNLLLGRYVVMPTSCGANVSGSADQMLKELKETYKDVGNVIKSSFGAQGCDAAVIVVPNTTSEERRIQICEIGHEAGFNITQVIQENVAVAEAYAEKAKPSSDTKLAIISVSGGILDVSIISIVQGLNGFILHNHKAHNETIDFEEHKSGGHSGGGLFGAVGGFVGGVVHTIVDPFDKVFNALTDMLEGLVVVNEKNVDKVIFVGKASRSEKVHNLVKERFKGAEVWMEVESDEVAAYGAAVISYQDKRVHVYYSDPRIDGQGELSI